MASFILVFLLIGSTKKEMFLKGLFRVGFRTCLQMQKKQMPLVLLQKILETIFLTSLKSTGWTLRPLSS